MILLGKWILVTVLVIALAWALLPRLAEAAIRYQNYPKLLNQVVSLREQAEEAEKRANTFQAAAEAATSAGIDEGMRRVYGEWLAHALPELELRSVTDVDGALVLVAQYAEDADTTPAIDARLALADAHTGAIKGVLLIVDVDVERRLVFLTCVEQRVPVFWAQLAERAPADSSPPANVALEPVSYPYPGHTNSLPDTVQREAPDEH